MISILEHSALSKHSVVKLKCYSHPQCEILSFGGTGRPIGSQGKDFLDEFEVT